MEGEEGSAFYLGCDLLTGKCGKWTLGMYVVAMATDTALCASVCFIVTLTDTRLKAGTHGSVHSSIEVKELESSL